MIYILYKQNDIQSLLLNLVSGNNHLYIKYESTANLFESKKEEKRKRNHMTNWSSTRRRADCCFFKKICNIKKVASYIIDE